MTPKNRIAIDNFLGILQSTSRGCAIVINMYDSCAQKLISYDILRAFLLDCVQTLGLNPSKDAIAIIEDVSCGYGSKKQNYLRQCKQKNISDGNIRLSNTINTDSFHLFLLDEKYKAGGVSLLPIVLPRKPVDTPSGIREYQVRLSKITADSNWKNPTATLGKPLPQPSNCWITTEYFGNDTNTPKYPDNPATEARDKLGLIDCSAGSFLLRLSFLASSIAKIPDNELARPVFSDLGNSRFRVHQSSKRAIKFAQQGWGATTHLGKFGKKKFHNSTGACERVSSALPLTALEDLTVELLGRVTENRGIETHDNDEAYAKKLQSRKAPIIIKKKLLSFLK